MAIKPIETEMFHSVNDIVVKAKSRTIDLPSWRDVSVVYECIAKIRMGFDDLNVIRKLHFMIALHCVTACNRSPKIFVETRQFTSGQCLQSLE